MSNDIKIGLSADFDGTSAYNGGWNKSKCKWGNTETSGYTPAIKRRMAGYQNGSTPLPPGLRQGDRQVTSASGGQLSGEMSVSLDLSDHAKRLLQPPQAPISGRVGRPSSNGVTATW